MVKGANSTSIRLRLLEAGLNETLVFKTLVTPCTFSVLQLAVRSTEQKGKSVSESAEMKLSVLIFAGSVGQPGAEHHTSATGLHLATRFGSYFLVTLLKSFCKSVFTFWRSLSLLVWVLFNFHEEPGVALRMFYWNGDKTRYSTRVNQEVFALVCNIV